MLVHIRCTTIVEGVADWLPSWTARGILSMMAGLGGTHVMQHRDMDEMLAAISDEETLEAQLEQARKHGAGEAETKRLRTLLADVLRREVKAEGEAQE